MGLTATIVQLSSCARLLCTVTSANTLTEHPEQVRSHNLIVKQQMTFKLKSELKIEEQELMEGLRLGQGSNSHTQNTTSGTKSPRLMIIEKKSLTPDPQPRWAIIVI